MKNESANSPQAAPSGAAITHCYIAKNEKKSGATIGHIKNDGTYTVSALGNPLIGFPTPKQFPELFWLPS